MCLDKLQEFPVKRKYGWKIFSTKEGLRSPFFRRTRYRINKWFDSRECSRGREVLVDFNHTYRVGFHIYVRRGDARTKPAWELWPRTYCLKKVEFKEVLATGVEDGGKVIVARWMKIMPSRRRVE